MNSQEMPPPLERVPSGIPGLDVILDGGFLKGGVYILQGTPGAGKTILANQLCFNLAAQGARILYITLLAETHARMLQHLSALSFFDSSRIPDQISYMSAFGALEQEGLKGLLSLLRRELRARDASVLVLDGFVAVGESATSDREFKKFVHDLQIHANLVGCTTFLLTSGTATQVPPEYTMVDGVLELADELFGRRAERTLTLRKFRGSRSIRGRHTFQISNDGITVHPRIEGLLAHGSAEDASAEVRIPSGIARMDKLIGGGLNAGSTLVVLGPSGSGKTAFGLQFLSKSSDQEPGLLWGAYETPQRVLAKASAMGLPFDQLLQSGALEIRWQPPTEQHIDAVCNRLLAAVKARKVRRLFVDGLNAFQAMVISPERLPHIFTALANELRRLGVTTVCTMELLELFGPQIDAPLPNTSALFENLVIVRQIEMQSRLRRTITIVKIRDSAHDTCVRELDITNRGLQIKDPIDFGAGLTTGHVRETAPPKRKPRGKGKR